jgi:hypothetical protein
MGTEAMKTFDSLTGKLRAVLKKHPEIHFKLPHSPTEMDLAEAAFVIENFLSSKVIEDDSLEDWLDSFRFYRAVNPTGHPVVLNQKSS